MAARSGGRAGKRTRPHEHDMYVGLRKVQRQSGCTTSTLKLVVKHMQPFFKCESNMNVQLGNKKLFKSTGATLLQIHGCVGCHDYVYLPDEERNQCPLCGHARHTNGNANEVLA